MRLSQLSRTLTLFAGIFVLTLAGCSSSSRTPDHYADAGYGRSANDPIRVGGILPDGAPRPANERAYLDLLRSPDGERVTYERTRSCCGFETPHGVLGTGMLDVYAVEYPGLECPVLLCLNMYDPAEETLRAPDGSRLVQR